MDKQDDIDSISQHDFFIDFHDNAKFYSTNNEPKAWAKFYSTALPSVMWYKGRILAEKEIIEHEVNEIDGEEEPQILPIFAMIEEVEPDSFETETIEL